MVYDASNITFFGHKRYLEAHLYTFICSKFKSGVRNFMDTLYVAYVSYGFLLLIPSKDFLGFEEKILIEIFCSTHKVQALKE